MTQQSSEKSAEEIRTWILSQVAAELGIAAAEIDVDEPLTRYGLDSMTAVVLTGELEDWLGRTIAPDLLGQLATVGSLVRHLAAESRPRGGPTNQPVVDEPEVEPAAWQCHPPTRFQRLIRRLTVRSVRLLIRIEVEGLANVPDSGPFIVASNHLHIMDAPVLFSVLPGSTVFFVSDHMLKFPLLGWYLGQLGQSIYVARGKGDRQALGCALAVLREGGTLTIAPEGRISRTGGLLQGQTGAAFLASRAGVPIVPVVLYGQEEMGRHLLRLRRSRVAVRVGTPIGFPAGRVGTRELEGYTEIIMRSLARMLPPRYRGFYAAAEGEGDSKRAGDAKPPAGASSREFTETGG